jgi:hypothetical protein
MLFWRFLWNLIEGCTWLRKVYHRSPACLVSSDLLANKLYTRIWLHNGFHLQAMCWCLYWFWLCPIMYKIQTQGTCLVSQVVSRPLHLHWETLLPGMLSFVEPCSNEKELYRRQDMLLSIRLKSKQMSVSLSSLQTANRANLLEGGITPVETNRTQGLENSGLISLQRQIMRGMSWT